MEKSTLTSVQSLKDHIPLNWWENYFDQSYLMGANQRLNEANTRNDVDTLINMTKIIPDMKILDVCCGQGRHILELLHRGFSQIKGVDGSQVLLDKFKEELENHYGNNHQVEIEKSDVRLMSLEEGKFDVGYIMGNSLGYSDKVEDDVIILKNMFKGIKSGGKIFLETNDGDFFMEHLQPRIWTWQKSEDGEQYMVLREREIATESSGTTKLAMRVILISPIHGLIREKFYSIRLFTKDLLIKIMQEAGFVDITVTNIRDNLNPSKTKVTGSMMDHSYFTIGRKP